jgi:hypothetical protein
MLTTSYQALRISLISLAFGILFWSNLRVIYKYLPVPGAALLLFLVIYLATMYFIFFKGSNIQFWISKPVFIGIVLILTFAIIYFSYPIADSLKIQMRGSDQDDCVILGAQRLIQGLFPYSVRSYYGNPCSPAPGMLILYLPFVYLHAYIGGAFALLLAALASLRRQSCSWLEPGCFLFFLSISLLWWELQVVGSDLIALGLGLVLVMTILPKIIANQQKIYVVLIGVLVGFLASTRINLFFIFPFISIFIFLHWKKGAFLFFFSALFSALIPTLWLYSLNPVEFTPFHLVGKAGVLLPPMAFLCAALVCAGLGVFGLALGRKSLHYGAASLFLGLAPMLCILALADIWNRQWQWSQWEGANYLMPILPIAALIMAQFRKNNT